MNDKCRYCENFKRVYKMDCEGFCDHKNIAVGINRKSCEHFVAKEFKLKGWKYAKDNKK